MKKSKNKNMSIYIIIAVLFISLLLPLCFSLGRDNKNDDIIMTDYGLEIANYSIEFEQNSYALNLVSGEIETNVKISNVFINANGFGCVNINYTQVPISNGYYIISLFPTNNLLSLAFDGNTTIKVDVYVQHANCTYKVCSKDVAMASCWSSFI